MTLIDVVLGIAIAVILWFATGNFTVFVTQIPIFFVNVYIVLVANSYRKDLIDTANGVAGSTDASRPKGA